MITLFILFFILNSFFLFFKEKKWKIEISRQSRTIKKKKTMITLVILFFIYFFIFFFINFEKKKKQSV